MLDTVPGRLTLAPRSAPQLVVSGPGCPYHHRLHHQGL